MITWILLLMACVIETPGTLSEGTRTNSTLTLGVTPNNGDRIVIFLMSGQSGGLAVTGPSGFSAVTGWGASAQMQFGADPWRTRFYCFEKVASGEASGSYVCTHASGSSGGIIYRVSGAHASTAAATALTVDAEGGGNGSSMLSPSVTPAADGAAILWFGGGWDAVGAQSPTAGTTPTFTEYWNVTTGSLYSQGGILTTAGATGTKAVVTAQASDRPWIAGMVSIEASAGAATNSEFSTRVRLPNNRVGPPVLRAMWHAPAYPFDKTVQSTGTRRRRVIIGG